MVHRQQRGKSLRLDRVFAGVGRIALASGTDHVPTFRRINAAFTAIHQIGRLDILFGVMHGEYQPLLVLHYYERGQLDRLPTKGASAGLLAALETFRAEHECSVSYRADLGTSIRHIASVCGKAGTVADLPRYLRELKPRMKGTPVAFNRLRAHMLAFASERDGKHSALWVEVTRVNRFKKAEGARPRKLQRRPLTVAELDLVCAAFVDVPVYHGVRGGGKAVRRVIPARALEAMARMLATTGMRPAEYWMRDGATWESHVGHLWVAGTKTPAARRPTFSIVDPWGPQCGEQFFRREFARATEKALRTALDTYSLRRTFAAWCESARVEPSRWNAYLGHGPKTVSDIYLQTKVLPFVASDAAQVLEFMRAERSRVATPSLRLETGQ